MPQSFLFAGPKGSGKTSAARIVARIINCTNPKEGEACGDCENCQEILKGGSIDVIEMDAASNRGIEDIRSLKDRVYLLPAKLKKKVFIVDEVHMLTKEAFNALLKLIEEPPKHTVFILCTTDEDKIPETVLSRLVKIEFYKGNKNELRKSIERVVEGEGLTIEPEAVDEIIARSDGSFRNLQRTLNEITMEYGKKVGVSEVVKFFGTRFGDYLPKDIEVDLVEARLQKILTSIEKMAERGVDFKTYREGLIRYFQEKLLVGYGVGSGQKSQLSNKEMEKWLGLLILAGKIEKDSPVDQLPLELAVAEFLEGKSGEVAPKEKVEEVKIEMEEVKVDRQEVIIESSNKDIEENWGKLLQTVKPFNHSVEAFLRAARPRNFEGSTLMIEVYYPFHKDKLEEQKNRMIVEKGLKIVFGQDLLFECVLSKTKKSLVIDNNTPVEKVSEALVDEGAKTEESHDIYDVAKQIFG